MTTTLPQRRKAQPRGPTPTAALPVGQGRKYVRVLGTLVQQLHGGGTARARAGNRRLFYDQSATLLLLYFVPPTGSSRRGWQPMTTLAAVQPRWGVRRTALGSRSEAAQVCEARLLQDVSRELALRAWQPRSPAEEGRLRDRSALEGSLLPHCCKGRYTGGITVCCC